MSEIKTEIKQNTDGSYTITDAHSTADVVRWLLTQDTRETILYLLDAPQRPVAPPHKWVGLTDEEMEEVRKQAVDLFIQEVKTTGKGRNEPIKFGRLVEAKLKEKNT